MSQKSDSSAILPRKGSTMYDFMRETADKQKKSLSKFKLLNRYLVVPLYRSNILPLFFAGKVIVLLYTKGRKSGKQRITPVEYRNYDNGKILLFSSRGKNGDWFKNIESNPKDFRMKIGFRKFSPKYTVSSSVEKLEILKWYVQKFPNTAKELFGFQKKIDLVSNELLLPISDFIEILQIER